MEGDDRYPREHGEAALALSSFKIKERSIQNLFQLANPNGGSDVVPEEMIIPNPNGGHDVVPVAQPQEMIRANPTGGNNVVLVGQPEEMIMADPNGGNDVVLLGQPEEMIMPNPTGGNDVVPLGQPEEMIMPNPNGGHDVVPVGQPEEMIMANPNVGNDVVPLGQPEEEMIMANPNVDPDATESSSQSTLNPSGVTLSFASYTSPSEPASSSEIPLSEVTVNYSEGHSVCSTSKELYKGGHVKPARAIEDFMEVYYDVSPQASVGQSWVEEEDEEPPKGDHSQ